MLQITEKTIRKALLQVRKEAVEQEQKDGK